MNKEKLAQTAIEKGLSTLVVLEGKAPEQHNDFPVQIKGTIDAPFRFIEGRITEFLESKRHALVSKTDGVIKLVFNEQSAINCYQIIGQIEVAKKFKALGINDERSYTPSQLANKFKLLRAIFPSNGQHASICTTLRNLKTKVNSDIEKLDDRKGNVSEFFKQTVESNMPDAIKLRVPVIEGEEPVEIEVNVLLEADGREILCYLESIDAAELIEQQFAERINEEVEKIKDFITVIYC